MLSPQELKLLMEIEWHKKGVEFAHCRTRWEVRNGCIYPAPGGRNRKKP